MTTNTTKQAEAAMTANDAWEAYLAEQKHVVGMPGLRARPAFIAGFLAAAPAAPAQSTFVRERAQLEQEWSELRRLQAQYAAPAQSGEADRRADVAKALGLPKGNINGQKIGFAWEYLLGMIEQLRTESDQSAARLDDERAAFDDWWERRGPEVVNHAWTEDACWFAWQARAAFPQSTKTS